MSTLRDPTTIRYSQATIRNASPTREEVPILVVEFDNGELVAYDNQRLYNAKIQNSMALTVCRNANAVVERLFSFISDVSYFVTWKGKHKDQHGLFLMEFSPRTYGATIICRTTAQGTRFPVLGSFTTPVLSTISETQCNWTDTTDWINRVRNDGITENLEFSQWISLLSSDSDLYFKVTFSRQKRWHRAPQLKQLLLQCPEWINVEGLKLHNNWTMENAGEPEDLYDQQVDDTYDSWVEESEVDVARRVLE